MENYVYIKKGSLPQFIPASVEQGGFVKTINERPLFNREAVEKSGVDKKELIRMSFSDAVKKYPHLIIRAGVFQDYAFITEEEYTLTLYKKGERAVTFVFRPQTNTYEINGRLMSQIEKIIRPFGRYYKSLELDELGEFGVKAGWRYSADAIKALESEGYKVVVR